MSKFHYEDLRVPGLDIPVTATSIMDEATEKMSAIFEVYGGKGRITIEYGPELDVTIATDKLSQHVPQLLLAMTGRMAMDVMFQNMVAGLEQEFGDSE